MKTSVVHCKKEPFDILIDRTTFWGNPFKIGRNFSTGQNMSREDVIAAFENWLFNSTAGKMRLARIKELKGKRLGCWCKPLACHGDVYARIINET